MQGQRQEREEPLTFGTAGYSTHWLVLKNTTSTPCTSREVLFTCGNYCYEGRAEVLQEAPLQLRQVPSLARRLNAQADMLGFMCATDEIPANSRWAPPRTRLLDMVDWIAEEISGETSSLLTVGASRNFGWVDAAHSTSHYELVTGKQYDELRDIELAMSKTCGRGVTLTVIWHAGSGNFYAVLEDGETSELRMLDDRYPDVSGHLQGVQLRNFCDAHLVRLVLWQTLPSMEMDGARGVDGAGVLAAAAKAAAALEVTDVGPGDSGEQPATDVQQVSTVAMQPRPRRMSIVSKARPRRTSVLASSSTVCAPATPKSAAAAVAAARSRVERGDESEACRQVRVPRCSIAGEGYASSYCIMLPAPATLFGTNDSVRHVLTRHGRDCFAGHVQLPTRLGPDDVPELVQTLCQQQLDGALQFAFDADAVPLSHPFAPPMQAFSRMLSCAREQIVLAEKQLVSLTDRLSAMGLKDTANGWLDGQGGAKTFFELQFAGQSELDRVEIIASKVYISSLVLHAVYNHGSLYVTMLESGNAYDSGSGNALLHPEFPAIGTTKARGVQLAMYEHGVEDFDSLRKVCMWQTECATFPDD